MSNELVDWLISSKPGETAVAPFATSSTRDIEFSRFVLSVDGVEYDYRIKRVSLGNHGSIDFVSMIQGARVIRGNLWDHCFEVTGKLDARGHEFMSMLHQRVLSRGAEQR